MAMSLTFKFKYGTVSPHLMSRHLGPRVREMRALGVDLPGLSRKSIERRPYPPGQHGPSTKRRKFSEYKVRLMEKQKLRLYYGVTERQLRNLVRLAGAQVGNTGERLVALLESRLDNVVFRAGFARTIPAARQLVTHGHVEIDGHRVDRPAYRVGRGERIALRAKSRELAAVATSLVDPITAPRWLELDVAQHAVTVREVPDRTSLLVTIDLRLVIEFYAQRS